MECHMYLLFNWAKHIPWSEENLWCLRNSKEYDFFSILLWNYIGVIWMKLFSRFFSHLQHNSVHRQSRFYG